MMSSRHRSSLVLLLLATVAAACLPSLADASTVTLSTSHGNNSTTNNKEHQYCRTTTDNNRFRIYVAILIFVFVVGLLGNLIAVTVILLSRSLRRQWTNIFVASLNLCDIGVILFVIPIRIGNYLYDTEFCFDIHVCRFFNTADVLFLTSSISHLFVMAIERFIAVRVPFLYQRIFNKQLTIKIIAATWLYSIVWTVMSTFNWNSLPTVESSALITEVLSHRTCVVENKTFYISIYVVVYIIPLGVMAVLYSLILNTALKQQKMIRSLAPSYLRQDDQVTQKRKQEVSASKTVAVIYGAFTICLLPLAVIGILLQVCLPCLFKFKADYPTLADAIFTTFLVVLPAIHSCLNPFIYIIFHRRFREALKALLRGKFKALTEHSFRKGSKSNTSCGSPVKAAEQSV